MLMKLRLHVKEFSVLDNNRIINIITNMNIIVNEDTPHFASWFAGAAKITHDHHVKMGYTQLPQPKFTAIFGTRYVRIMRDGSAHAFIDRTNGDVLKPASWKAPAKHSRGNIFLSDNGLNCMGEYGPCYLR